MYSVAVTGGIGSGKSRVCEHFSALGYAVYSADVRAKELMRTDQTLVNSICKSFGADSYLPEGNLNRAYLAAQVFAHEDKLKALNALVHPVVIADFNRWKNGVRTDKTFVVKEAAIIYESQTQSLTDCVIVVYCPKAERVRRVCERDKLDENTILARMEKQFSDKQKLALADYVIYNDGLNPLEPQVREFIAWQKSQNAVLKRN